MENDENATGFSAQVVAASFLTCQVGPAEKGACFICHIAGNKRARADNCANCPIQVAQWSRAISGLFAVASNVKIQLSGGGVDWELEQLLLGVGGFGEVWKARNPHFDGLAPAALKFCLDVN
jgi:hypothetical protein